MLNKPVIEVVLFEGLSGVSPQTMRMAAEAVTPQLRGYAGFVSRSFGVGADGRYIDIVHWQDRATAQSAAAQVMVDPGFREFFALIDAGSVQMMHFESA